MKKSQPMPRLGDAGLVLRERGEDLELGDPGADVERVDDHQRHEDAVAEDVAIAARRSAARSTACRGSGTKTISTAA